MRSNPTWKDWFVFSKKERTIVLSLAVLLTACLSFIIFYQPETGAIVVENLDERIAQLSAQGDDSMALRNTGINSHQSLLSDNTQVQPFYFDPNTLDEAGFVRLGLREKTARTIMNYRSKGGRFYKADDLRKIYGLREEEADRLVPYVRIASSQKRDGYADRYPNDGYSSYHKTKPQVIDINTASAARWESLPAIGEVLGNRIVKYREKIGGFTSVSDVKKVYGITDSAYHAMLPYLSVSGSKPEAQATSSVKSISQRININKATAAELKSNPNIPSDVAEAIVIYRKQHGNYTSVEGIKKIVFINDNMYQKIAPLLSVE